MGQLLTPRNAAAAGVVGGLLLSMLVVPALGHRGDGPVDPHDGAAAADAFLAAWRRSRTETYAMEATFSRVSRDGRTLESASSVAQRPPDRLSVGLGSVTGRLGGRVIGCASSPDGELSCREGGAAPDYGAEVEGELRTLAGYVRGPGAPYAVVTEGDGCHRLVLRARMVAPPYGTEATFCFDDRTGAPVRTEIVRPEATDRIVATEVRDEVTDADLVLPDRVPG